MTRQDRQCTCECNRGDCEPTDYSRCLRCVLECTEAEEAFRAQTEGKCGTAHNCLTQLSDTIV